MGEDEEAGTSVPSRCQHFDLDMELRVRQANAHPLLPMGLAENSGFDLIRGLIFLRCARWVIEAELDWSDLKRKFEKSPSEDRTMV
jgi:hypothetical protein